MRYALSCDMYREQLYGYSFIIAKMDSKVYNIYNKRSIKILNDIDFNNHKLDILYIIKYVKTDMVVEIKYICIKIMKIEEEILIQIYVCMYIGGQ